MDETGKEMMTLVEGDQDIAVWTDDKKKDFVEVFKKRAEASRTILKYTAHLVFKTALGRKFISHKHQQKLSKAGVGEAGDHYYVRHNENATERDASEITRLAEEKADKILSELPPIRDAVQIIDPVTARKMDRLEKLKKDCKAKYEKLQELVEPIDMEDLDQTMTIADFRKLAKERIKQRDKLTQELNEAGKEGQQLEDAVNKALYAGLPGLSDAVIKVITDLHERAVALGETTRRVEERVMFGDSQAALDLLKGFERDEVTVSDEIKTEFAQALEKLKVARKTKQLREKSSG